VFGWGGETISSRNMNQSVGGGVDVFLCVGGVFVWAEYQDGERKNQIRDEKGRSAEKKKKPRKEGPHAYISVVSWGTDVRLTVEWEMNKNHGKAELRSRAKARHWKLQQRKTDPPRKGNTRGWKPTH